MNSFRPNLSIIFLVLASLSLASCNFMAKAPDADEPIAFENEDGVLQLNNGAKWQANPETTAGVEELKNLVSNFEQSDSTSALAAYNQLGAAMHETMKTIFAQCTMTGDAHNELHDFLYPMLGDIKKLQGDNLEVAQNSFANLSRQLGRYSAFFE
jgi:hypothetical protein